VAVRLYAADLDLKMQRYKDAAAHYEWVRSKQPDNIVVLNNLAIAYQHLKDARALEAAERAYKLNPANPAIADTLGWILVEQGNTSRGLPLLEKAVAAAPKDQSARFHLAQAWLRAGDRQKARDELEGLLSVGAVFPEQKQAQELLQDLRK
jgi:cytochrome c-type biogenesis protein CcmH/NrfG